MALNHKNRSDIALIPREAQSHKGIFGTVLIIGSSRGMTGAVSLCGSAAICSGCGLTRLIVPDVCQDTVAGYDRRYTTIGVPSDSSGKIKLEAFSQILDESSRADAVAIGPGLGRSDELVQLVCQLYKTLDKPMVIDADALNALAIQFNSSPIQSFACAYDRILTPHPGEFARLVPCQSKQSREQQIESVRVLAAQLGAVIILKGHQSAITNGEDVYLNSTGNAGMATGGSGDVLTGIIASLVAQGYAPLDAARLGAYIHGKAGDCAEKKLTQYALTAESIIQFLPKAFKRLIRENRTM